MLSLPLCNVWASLVCPSGVTQGQRSIYASMIDTLWWGQLKERSLLRLWVALQRASVRVDGLEHRRAQDISPPHSRCCSEAFVATSVAESFIVFYLVPKFDKTSFTFHHQWQDCMWLCVGNSVCITCFIDVIQKLRRSLKSIINILKRSLNQKKIPPSRDQCVLPHCI